MRHTRRSLILAAGGTALLAGCFGDNGDDTEPTNDDDGDDMDTDDGDEDDMESDDSGDGDPDDADVKVRNTPLFEEILVGPDELSLYMFDVDEQGEMASQCDDNCAQNWPPLIVEDDDVIAGEGVDAELTTFERDDGELQVAANGWPLYYWIGDEEPGDVNGQAVEDVWWVLSPSGDPIRDEDDDGNGSGGPGY